MTSKVTEIVNQMEVYSRRERYRKTEVTKCINMTLYNQMKIVPKFV